MQVGDTTHGEPRKVCDCDTFSSCHCNRQSANRSRLIDDEQHAALLFALDDECSKFGFVVRQSTIEQALCSEIKHHSMMGCFANVDAAEDLNTLLD